jgi:hypothetical protein
VLLSSSNCSVVSRSLRSTCSRSEDDGGIGVDVIASDVSSRFGGFRIQVDLGGMLYVVG